MENFKLRNYFGEKAVIAFDEYINMRDGWQSQSFGVEDRYASKNLEWIRSKCISDDVIDEFRKHAISVIGKARFDSFYKRLSGKIPIPIRWESDRLLIYKNQIVGAVDVKAKGPKYSNWAVEVMALLANSQAHIRYGCPVFYAFPPKDHEKQLYGHFDYWTIANTADLTDGFRTLYNDGSFTAGSRTPFVTISQKYIDFKLLDFIQEVESRTQFND